MNDLRRQAVVADIELAAETAAGDPTGRRHRAPADSEVPSATRANIGLRRLRSAVDREVTF
jgi:hypothetical protein